LDIPSKEVFREEAAQFSGDWTYSPRRPLERRPHPFRYGVYVVPEYSPPEVGHPFQGGL